MTRAKAAAPIRVMIVDDSAAARAGLTRVLSADPAITVTAVAADPYAAVEALREGLPDVLFLDVELPRMDGLTFLRRIMAQRPLPVVICSGHTPEGSDRMLEALAIGAVEVVAKPAGAGGMDAAAERIRMAAHAAARARVGRAAARPAPGEPAVAGVGPKLTADAVIPPVPADRIAAHAARIPRTGPLLCLGASTGGTEALRELLTAMPADAPPVAVVQHMPAGFTAAFARRLDGLCAMSVREAEDGAPLTPGVALIAPGDRHLAVVRQGGAYRARLIDGPPVSRHRPSVDVLLRSAAQAAGRNLVAAILTGMGDDGAQGMWEARAFGAATIAQDEATSVVFGMPREAIRRGAAAQVVPLPAIAAAMLDAAQGAMTPPPQAADPLTGTN